MPTPMEPLTKVLDELSDLVYEEWGDTPRAKYWLDQAHQYIQPALRDQLIHIKVSAVEKLELQRLSDEAGQTMSDYARLRTSPSHTVLCVFA